MKNRKLQGFTLIELIVVLAIVAILFTATIVAIRPGTHISDANTAKRLADVNAILNAISQYQVDNDGDVPTGITASDLNIGSGGSDADICSALVPTYISEIPSDPETGSYTDCADYDSNYDVSVTSSRVTVSSSEDSTITVSR